MKRRLVRHGARYPERCARICLVPLGTWLWVLCGTSVWLNSPYPCGWAFLHGSCRCEKEGDVAVSQDLGVSRLPIGRTMCWGLRVLSGLSYPTAKSSVQHSFHTVIIHSTSPRQQLISSCCCTRCATIATTLHPSPLTALSRATDLRKKRAL